MSISVIGKSKNSIQWMMLFSVTLIGALLRLYTIGTRSLWMDEIRQVNYYYNSQNFWRLVDNAAAQTQPPLDYFIGFYLLKYFSFSELLVRFPAFLFGLLSIPLAYFVTRLIADRSVALVSSVFVAFLPVLIQYSQEARPYAIFYFLVLCMLYLLGSAVRTRTTTKSLVNWGLFTFFFFLVLMTRVVSPAPIFLSLVVALYLSHRDKKIMGKLVFFSGIAGVAFYPFFLRLWAASTRLISVAQADPTMEMWTRILMALNPVSVKRLYLQHFPELFSGAYLLIICLFFIGVYFLAKNRHKNRFGFFFAAYALVEPIIHIATFRFIMHAPDPNPDTKYLIHSVIPILIVSAVGLHVLSKFMIARLRMKRDPKTLMMGVGGIFLLTIVSPLQHYYREVRNPDYRGVGHYLREKMKPEDVIVMGTFRLAMDFNPPLTGVGLYYPRNTESWRFPRKVVHVWTRVKTQGNVFFVLEHGTKGNLEPPGLRRFSDPNNFSEKSFYGFKVISPKLKKLNVRKNPVEVILDEALRFFPEDSSKSRILLAKSVLFCSAGRKQEAGYYWDHAYQLVSKNIPGRWKINNPRCQ